MSSPNLVNSIPNSFQVLTYSFTPAIYGESSSLQLFFDPTDTSKLPSKLTLTLANSFTIQNIVCNSFIDFVGSCNSISNNTV